MAEEGDFVIGRASSAAGAAAAASSGEQRPENAV